jgi:hypothetical protein
MRVRLRRRIVKGNLIEEGRVVGHGVEVGGAPEQQRLDQTALEVAMGRLDTAVLEGSGLLAAMPSWAHSAAYRAVRSSCSAAVRFLNAADRLSVRCSLGTPRKPGQRPLQSLGQGREALAALHHLHVTPAAVGQTEVVEAVYERLAAHRDGHARELS